MKLQLVFRTLGMGLLLLPLLAFADNRPKLAGTWEMDAAKSHVTDGRTITLTIDQTADRLTMTEVIKTDSSKKTITFSCATDATDCDFDEGGHKSKISIWYNGESVICCKTGGPAGDLVNEWHMKIAPDNTLAVDVEHVDPAGPAEALVFKRVSDATKVADSAHK